MFEISEQGSLSLLYSIMMSTVSNSTKLAGSGRMRMFEGHGRKKHEKGTSSFLFTLGLHDIRKICDVR